MKLGSTLKRIRLEKGLRQQDVASLLNMERSTVANWERDAKQPSLEALVSFCRNVGGSMEQIVGLEPPKQHNSDSHNELLLEPLVKLLAKKTGIPPKVLSAFIAALWDR